MTARFALLALALFAAPQAWAATHTVHVGGSGLVFTPNSVDVLVGDTITFTNDGGFHNAASDDAAFPFACAIDCGAQGSGSNTGWTSSVIVPATAAHKDIQFYCQIHGAAVMAGVIHVTNPVDLQSFEIN